MENDTIVFGGDATDIPPDEYEAVVLSIITKNSTKFGDFRAWDFELENGSIVGGSSSLFTGPKSKGGKWIVAILGRKPEAGEKVDLIGKPCRVITIVDDDGWPKVETVLPSKKAGGTPAAAAAQFHDDTPLSGQKPSDLGDLPF